MFQITYECFEQVRMGGKNWWKEKKELDEVNKQSCEIKKKKKKEIKFSHKNQESPWNETCFLSW